MTKTLQLSIILLIISISLQNCKESSYTCNNGTCQEVRGGGEYRTYQSCYQSCGSIGGAGYDCVAGSCVSVTSNATYSSQTACQQSCGGGGGSIGYNCVNNNCVYVTSGAMYSTLSGCQSSCGGGNCSYTTYPNSGQCSSGYSDVSSTACCPNTSPYYCSETGYCYSTCAAADAACSSAGVVKADVGGGGGGSAGYNCVSGSCTYVSSGATYASLSDCQSSCASSGCPYTMDGVWTRMTNTNGCGGIKINFSGTGGSVSSTVSGCCWWVGAVKWHSFNATDCTVQDRTIQQQSCTDMGYSTETIYWNGPNDITVGGINYVR